MHQYCRHSLSAVTCEFMIYRHRLFSLSLTFIGGSILFVWNIFSVVFSLENINAINACRSDNVLSQTTLSDSIRCLQSETHSSFPWQTLPIPQRSNLYIGLILSLVNIGHKQITIRLLKLLEKRGRYRFPQTHDFVQESSRQPWLGTYRKLSDNHHLKLLLKRRNETRILLVKLR